MLASPTTLPIDLAEARRRAAAVEAEVFRTCFALPPDLTIREWAEANREFGKGESEPGRYNAERVPYLIEVMDAISDPSIEEVVLQKPSQAGATEGAILNAIGFAIDQDPGPILVILPTLGEAEKFSKKKLAPMIRATPCLRGKVADARSRTGDNTILEKTFPHGTIGIVGATSGRAFRMVPARYVFGDELDGWDEAVADEGEQVALAKKRADRFWNRKFVWNSTPKLKRNSKIEKLRLETERHGAFHVPCPHCGHEQVLRWGGPDTPYGIKWDRTVHCRGCGEQLEDLDAPCPSCGGTERETRHDPDSAYYLCEKNGCVIEERHKYAIVPRGRYLTADGEPVLDGKARRVGFHFNALVVLLAGSEWPKLVREWLAAQGNPEKLQAFVNLVLAETWEDRSEDVAPEKLLARAAAYTNEAGEPVEVPDGVGLLVAGVDVQGDRLELVIRGFGAGEESWLIAHRRIYGDPERQSTWDRLDAHLTRTYRHEKGGEMSIEWTMVDAGYLKRHVYAFVRDREYRGVYASVGMDHRAREPLSRASRKNRDGVKPWTIGTTAFKDVLFARLKIQKPGPGYMHFCAGVDAEYFHQLAAEKPQWVSEGGRRVRRYIQTRDRNEAIDLEVMCLAAMHAYTAGDSSVLAEMAEEARHARPPEEEDEVDSATAARAPRRNRYVHGWRPR
ncbi:MAG TPA: terminase gpA endonuclease subunit [Longimicrobiales bacterium]